MNDREKARKEMFDRVVNFGSDHAADFPTGSTAATRFANLKTISDKLVAASAGQKPGSATAKEVQFDALRLDLQNIARTASAIAQDEPGFADKFRLPGNLSQANLKTTAQTVLTELGKTGVAAKFIAHEMPATLVADLQADIAAIGTAASAFETGREAGIGSTATIGPLIAAGMKEVNYLDAIMHNKYNRVADKLTAWLSASHIERTPQKKKEPVPTPTKPQT
jgi:hypothetical protein